MLLNWNKNSNSRTMPWKGEKDPYRIWLSEVILQQTRVQQGLKYYENFILSFPDVHALAAAPDDKIFKLWEGLGYYSRCRNLIETARYISKNLNGKFPDDHAGILSLKGVGAYTAAAISSFAFDLPFAVVDGNVLRVLSRITGSHLPVDNNDGRKYFTALAEELLPGSHAAEYNQAIMDFGAVICRPQPDCQSCFYSRHCAAFQKGEQLLLPVKEKKLQIKKRYLHYFYAVSGDYTAIAQRTGKDIWQQLYEFPVIETEKPLRTDKAQQLFEEKFHLEEPEWEYASGIVKQKLTHQELCFNFHKLNLNKKPELPGYKWVRLKDLSKYPFPKTLASFIKEELF